MVNAQFGRAITPGNITAHRFWSASKFFFNRKIPSTKWVHQTKFPPILIWLKPSHYYFLNCTRKKEIIAPLFNLTRKFGKPFLAFHNFIARSHKLRVWLVLQTATDKYIESEEEKNNCSPLWRRHVHTPIFSILVYKSFSEFTFTFGKPISIGNTQKNIVHIQQPYTYSHYIFSKIFAYRFHSILPSFLLSSFPSFFLSLFHLEFMHFIRLIKKCTDLIIIEKKRKKYTTGMKWMYSRRADTVYGII